MTDQYGNNSNRYQFYGLIGNGRLGNVYRCMDTFFGREAAVKVLHRESLSPEFLQFFTANYPQTIAAVSRLSNPGIIKTYEFTSINNVPAWSMELLNGTNLSQYIGNPIPCSQAASMLIPVADALAYAHQCGIIHGNLKPSNIMYNTNQVPVITDFGLADWLSRNGHGFGSFEAGAGIGSPEYLAPEQAQGYAIDGRTDVYSLGIILYEMITGRRPFSAVSPMETMTRQVSDQIPSPRYFTQNITPAAEQLIYQATAKNPANRIGSMGEFALMLRNIASDSSMGTYYPPASYYNNNMPSEEDDSEESPIREKLNEAVKTIKGNRKAQLICLAALILLIAGTVFGIITNNNKKIEAANAAATRQAIEAQETSMALEKTFQAQIQQTSQAEAEANNLAATAAALQATSDALMYAVPTPAPFVELPSIDVETEPVPAAVTTASGRFQSQSPADGTSFIKGEAFSVSWTLENTGSTQWDYKYKLVFDGGTNFTTGAVTEASIPDVWPNGAAALSLKCTAPQAPGQYAMYWHLEDENGNNFFSPLSISITVIDGSLTATPVPTGEVIQIEYNYEG